MMRSGLRNNSNECFINSALQCLAISPVIRDFIANYAKEDEKLIEVICKFKLGKFKADEINIESTRLGGILGVTLISLLNALEDEAPTKLDLIL